MRKSAYIFFLTSLLAFAITGCGDEDTELRWSNASGSGVTSIQWISAGTVDQTWNENSVLANTQTNDFKKVNKLIGEGQCVDTSGTLNDIQVNGTTETFAKLADGNSQTLTISGLKAKK